MAIESIFSTYIIRKIYGPLFLDIALKSIWNSIIELWKIGGSGILGIIPLLILIIIILIVPLIPLFIVGYYVHKLLKNNNFI